MRKLIFILTLALLSSCSSMKLVTKYDHIYYTPYNNFYNLHYYYNPYNSFYYRLYRGYWNVPYYNTYIKKSIDKPRYVEHRRSVITNRNIISNTDRPKSNRSNSSSRSSGRRR